jgi:phosphocarrier protein
MVSQKVTVTNPTGLHLRPAGIFCQEAMNYSCRITFRYGNSATANAKSVLSVLGACIKSGYEIEIICEGEDEQEALDALVKLVESGFGE